MLDQNNRPSIFVDGVIGVGSHQPEVRRGNPLAVPHHPPALAYRFGLWWILGLAA